MDVTLAVAFASVVGLSALLVRGMRVLAIRRQILDHPNERSSHQVPVPRLGGAAFVPGILLAAGLLAPQTGLPSIIIGSLIGGAIALYAISLLDDVLTLPTGIRFAVQFGAAFGFLFALWYWWPVESAPGLSQLASGPPPSAFRHVASVLSPPSPGFWLLAIWIVGVVNLYNFMDGIDGIAGLQGVVSGLAWLGWGTIGGAEFVPAAGAVAAAGALGFLTLNWPPAKIFMGDAGSTVLGFLFAAMPLLVVVDTGGSISLERGLVAGALVLWPFLLDGTFTILRRLKNRENILLAHRSHLYQRLVIAGRSHRQVTVLYGGLAILGAILGSMVFTEVKGAILVSIIGISVGFGGLWLGVVKTEAQRVLQVQSPAPQ